MQPLLRWIVNLSIDLNFYQDRMHATSCVDQLVYRNGSGVAVPILGGLGDPDFTTAIVVELPISSTIFLVSLYFTSHGLITFTVCLHYCGFEHTCAIVNLLFCCSSTALYHRLVVQLIIFSTKVPSTTTVICRAVCWC